MIALTLALALGAWDVIPSDGGTPEITFVESEAPTVSMVVAFGVGTNDDLSNYGLTAQAQRSMLEANGGLPLRQWNERLFADGASLNTATGRYRSYFVLSATKTGFPKLAAMLLPALLGARLNDAQIEGLRSTANPSGAQASTTEYVMQLLEPLVVTDAREPVPGKLQWNDVARVKQHVADNFTPANASVTFIGSFSRADLLPLVSRARGGERRVVKRPGLANDVRKFVSRSITMHVFGYPLPDGLSATDVAGVRVICRRIHEALLDSLRGLGLAYSVDMLPVFTPWFDGVLILIPAYDGSGTDLEEYLLASLHSAVHAPLDDAGVNRFIEAIQAEDDAMLAVPELFASSMLSGHYQPVWASPEYRAALAALTPASVLQTSRALFVNERRRFYVKFFESNLPPRPPVNAPPPKKGTRR